MGELLCEVLVLPWQAGLHPQGQGPRQEAHQLVHFRHHFIAMQLGHEHQVKGVSNNNKFHGENLLITILD